MPNNKVIPRPIGCGSRFGHLTVVALADTRCARGRLQYSCKCVCGKTVTIQRDGLLGNKNRSCGCKHWPRLDLTGQTFGRWTVLHYDGSHEPRKSRWACECACGTKRNIRTNALRRGESISCGCARIELVAQTARQKREEQQISGVPQSYWKRLKTAASKREIPCELTHQQIANQYVKQQGLCFFSGVPISFSPEKQGRGSTASVDRLDSMGPYTASNIVLVHKDINRIKNAFAAEVFIHYCHRVATLHPLPQNKVSPLETPTPQPATLVLT